MKQFLLITCAFFFIRQSPVLAQKSWKNIFDGKRWMAGNKWPAKLSTLYQGMIMGKSVPSSPNSFLH
jgi:hypothetical protein